MDTIGDYLTRVRNAIKANHRIVEIPASNLKKEVTKIRYESFVKQEDKLRQNIEQLQKEVVKELSSKHQSSHE